MKPAPAIASLLTLQATSWVASLLKARFVAFAVTITLSRTNPPCSAAIILHGNPWVNSSQVSDQAGADDIIALPNLQANVGSSDEIVKGAHAVFLCVPTVHAITLNNDKRLDFPIGSSVIDLQTKGPD